MDKRRQPQNHTRARHNSNFRTQQQVKRVLLYNLFMAVLSNCQHTFRGKKVNRSKPVIIKADLLGVATYVYGKY